jgi:N-methylhydantoinase A/oxoprolinase/acetone carboxylase beta subunit
MYVIGIDVGGTHTDAALLKDSSVAALAKVPTDHGDLFASTRRALEEIWRHYPGDGPVKLQLSTTLSTNTIVEGKGRAHPSGGSSRARGEPGQSQTALHRP